MNMGILTLIMYKKFIWALKTLRQMAMGIIGYANHLNSMFHILREVDA